MTPVIVFVIVANAVSWAIWLPLVAAAMGWTDANPSPYLHLFGGIGPLVAAFVVARLYGGAAASRELWKRVRLWRVPARWHAVAWFGPVVLYGIAAVTVRMLWGGWPDVARFGQTEAFPDLPLLLYWLANILFYGWGEETGWRGFLLPLLQARMSALWATLVITPIWVLWHLPLFFFVDGYMAMGATDAAGWILSILTGAILMTWLFNSAAGSVLVVAVFHGMLDVVFNSPSSGDLATVIGVLVTLWGLWVVASKRWADLSAVPRQMMHLHRA